jgi:hypothetical protein
MLPSLQEASRSTQAPVQEPASPQQRTTINVLIGNGSMHFNPDDLSVDIRQGMENLICDHYHYHYRKNRQNSTTTLIYCDSHSIKLTYASNAHLGCWCVVRQRCKSIKSWYDSHKFVWQFIPTVIFFVSFIMAIITSTASSSIVEVVNSWVAFGIALCSLLTFETTLLPGIKS